MTLNYCPAHYRRRRLGLPVDVPIREYSRGAICKADGCDSRKTGLGFCDTHYKRHKRGEDVDRPLRRRPRGVFTACSMDDCAKRAVGQGLCNLHWQRQRYGRGAVGVSTRGMSLKDRMAHYTESANDNGCMLWRGGLNKDGYPIVSHRGKGHLAHRVSLEIASGAELRPGSVAHHKCGIRQCVAPRHLSVVEPHENTAEMFERKFYQQRIAELEAQVAATSQQTS